MADLSEFKKMIDELDRRRSELHKNLSEFQQLERELEHLQHRAPTDASAQRKLNQVQMVMDGDFLQKRNALIKQVNDLTSNIQTLTNSVACLSPSKKTLTPPPSNPIPVVRRPRFTFV